MSNRMYVAVELNEDGSFNNMGKIAQTKEKAWDHVQHTFSPNDTQIWELIPRFNVKAPAAVEFVKLDPARTDDEQDYVGN